MTRKDSPFLRRVAALLAGLGVILVMTGLVLRGLRLFSDDIGHGFVAGPPTYALGDGQTVAAATGRPALRITAAEFVLTDVVGKAPKLRPHNRWLAVSLTIRNAGKRTWVSEPGTSALLTDDLGVEHRSQTVPTVTAGTMLPHVLRLRPGQTVRGYLVFQATQDHTITKFTLTVGPGAPAAVSWVIDHQ